MPSARGARAKLLERKLAARRRESEAELETLACESGSYLPEYLVPKPNT